MLRPGIRFGAYTLVREIGRGGAAVVWLAQQKRIGRRAATVALKLPYERYANLTAVRADVQTWQSLHDHPNVVRLRYVGLQEGQAYLVSDYVPDGTLLGWLERHGGKAPSYAAAVSMMAGILAGLEHIHGQRVIHRDLKPANVLMQGDWPLLTDFGISRNLQTIAHTKHTAGTPAYMSPESFEGAYSPQSDLWSAGVIFTLLLTGRLPFSNRPEIWAQMLAIRQNPPLPLPPEIPLPFQQIIYRALEKDPARRFQSAQEMRAALLAVPVGASPQSPPRRSGTLSSSQDGYATQSRRPMGLALVFAALFLTFASVAVYLTHPFVQTDAAHASDVKGVSKPVVDPNPKKRKEASPILPTPVMPAPLAPPHDATGLGQSRINAKDGAEMVWIPAGNFIMGADDLKDDSDESGMLFDDAPRHTVTLDGYWIYRYPVTVHQYFAFCRATGHRRPPPPAWGWQENHPIVNVTWEDAVAYGKWAFGDSDSHLPTEAQWEKAARGTHGNRYPWGNGWQNVGVNTVGGTDPNQTAANTDASGDRSVYGVRHMGGNVAQWCADWYDEDYYRHAPRHNPQGPGSSSGGWRVLRGGRWNSEFPYEASSVYRNFVDPDTIPEEEPDKDTIGFRCVGAP